MMVLFIMHSVTKYGPWTGPTSRGNARQSLARYETNRPSNARCKTHRYLTSSDGQKLTKKLLTNSLTTFFKLDH